METPTKQFRQRIAEFLRRRRLTPSEFGERSHRRPEVLRRPSAGKSPTSATADRVLAFVESFDETSSDEGRGLRPASVRGDEGHERR